MTGATVIPHPSSRPPDVNVVCATQLLAHDPPPQRWLVDKMIPDATVTLFSGDGGVGKSLLAMQLAVAVSSGCDWIGTIPEIGGALYVSAEDDQDEIARRLNAIVSGTGLNGEDLSNLHIIDLAGRDAVMATTNPKVGIVEATALFTEILSHLNRLRPRLIVIDNLADAFAGNENARLEARQFISLLRQAAVRFDCAVLLLAHPSLTGLASGSGSSGSTAWSNSVRSRLYLERPQKKKGRDDDIDPDLRVLKLKKANYGKSGLEIRLRWCAGRFGIDPGKTSFERLAADANADEAFLAVLAEFKRQGRSVCAKSGTTYAPSLFVGHPLSNGVQKQALIQAMERLLLAGRIESVMAGPPSRRRSQLILS